LFIAVKELLAQIRKVEAKAEAFGKGASAYRMPECFLRWLRNEPRTLAKGNFVAATPSTGFVKWVRMVYDFGRSAVVDSHPGQ